jgi:hypothetical protein
MPGVSPEASLVPREISARTLPSTWHPARMGLQDLALHCPGLGVMAPTSSLAGGGEVGLQRVAEQQ